MNKYVVAYLSSHTGLLEQHLIVAESELAACNKLLDSEYPSWDELQDVMAGSDSWIEALNINDALAE